MSFNIGLSGMRAASKDLNVTGNNIANAGTVGFKQSRAEFSDVYAASVSGTGKNPVGSGVLLSNISQQFNQGNINYTQNALDLAINGNGFFQVSNNGALSYTRAGYFGTDREGALVDNFGYKLQGFPVDGNGNLQNGVVGDLQIQTTNQAPKATTKIDTSFNLNSTEKSPIAWQSTFDSEVVATLRSAPGTMATDTSTLSDDDAKAWKAGLDAASSDHYYNKQLNESYLAPDVSKYADEDDPAYIAAIKTAIASAMDQADANVLNDKAAVASVREAALGPSNLTFNPADPTTYNSSTSLNIYDSQGNAHVLTQYFVKTGANTWDMKALVDGRNPNLPASDDPYSITLKFNADGTLDSSNMTAGGDLNFDPASGRIGLNNWTPAISSNGNWVANGATSEKIAVDLTKSTQYSSAFAVNSVAQDGYTTGELAGLEIDDAGMIFARYTNGQSKVQGQIVLANFANTQGLTPAGKTQWVQSYESGEPVIGTPMSGTMGALQAGALEDSNVELSDQLVNLIVAQRNYQANAKTIETESAITQTIINLR